MKYLFYFQSEAGQEKVRTYPGGLRRIACADAFSLVEIVIAMGLVSFALLAILGTITTALNSTRSVVSSSQAESIASELIATIRKAPDSGKRNNFPIEDLTVITNASKSSPPELYIDAAGNTANKANAAFAMKYVITRELCRPTNSSQLFYVSLTLLWPPEANLTNASSFKTITGVTLP